MLLQIKKWHFPSRPCVALSDVPINTGTQYCMSLNVAVDISCIQSQSFTSSSRYFHVPKHTVTLKASLPQNPLNFFNIHPLVLPFYSHSYPLTIHLLGFSVIQWWRWIINYLLPSIPSSVSPFILPLSYPLVHVQGEQLHYWSVML